MDEKYQRKKVLGKGSFGKAYLVKNTEADELCVVKQMETSAMDSKERNEAVKEAMLLKRMDHPNIVRFQEVFMTRKGRLCIVMDYADGGDIHAEIKRREGELIPEAKIIEWFVQTCFALKHVHAQKVLHRDLKTQNIFLMLTGQIKLGDFGIARVLDATKDYAKTMVGTPYYLSPEIIEDRPYNFKSDIWSCGVVLYEMTTLKHPFDADSLVILASKILKDQYPPPDAMYTADLKELIRRMLCKDASMRPFIHDILRCQFLQGPSAEANAKYGLGLDLSDVSVPSTPPGAPPMSSAMAESPNATVDPAAESRPGLAERRRNEVASAQAMARPAASPDDGDTVLIGTLPAAARSLNASDPAALAQSSQAKVSEKEDEGEGEYDEEFEDYSGSEDGKDDNELKSSVDNLKIGGAEAYASPKDTLVAATNTGAPAEGARPGAIKAKADSLRSYLLGQMPRESFDRVYGLVRASGEVSPEVLQQRVTDVLGVPKGTELISLFQLLCLLEDVAANSTGAPQVGVGA